MPSTYTNNDNHAGVSVDDGNTQLLSGFYGEQKALDPSLPHLDEQRKMVLAKKTLNLANIATSLELVHSI